MNLFKICLLSFSALFFLTQQLIAQDYSEDNQEAAEEEYEIWEPISDPTAYGQRIFVEELLDIAGYVPEGIQIYQTLPNKARVFRVKLDSVTGGFVFVRWDKVKKENYIANKLIDPGVYYNLNAAKEIMRKQTQKAYFEVKDVLPQAPDQEQISEESLEGLREEFDLKNEEKKLIENQAIEKKKAKKDRKASRKEKKE
ncbi:hypothetical protein N9I28_01500 [Flavobacteriaceae bacterium]|nr:hypothetical protein [Flavobacteriaceae bacterium]|tara:strand:- start:911 stop:1504 length:594 start_codon:yes stop_codon:yes gene_type:complete